MNPDELLIINAIHGKLDARAELEDIAKGGEGSGVRGHHTEKEKSAHAAAAKANEKAAAAHDAAATAHQGSNFKAAQAATVKAAKASLDARSKSIDAAEASGYTRASWKPGDKANEGDQHATAAAVHAGLPLGGMRFGDEKVTGQSAAFHERAAAAHREAAKGHGKFTT